MVEHYICNQFQHNVRYTEGARRTPTTETVCWKACRSHRELEMEFKDCLGGRWHRIYQNTSWQRLNKVRMVGESERAEGQGIRVTGNFQELTAEAAQRSTSHSSKGTAQTLRQRPAVLLQVHHGTPTHTCPFLPSCLCTCCPSAPNVPSRPRQAGLTRPHAACSR